MTNAPSQEPHRRRRLQTTAKAASSPRPLPTPPRPLPHSRATKMSACCSKKPPRPPLTKPSLPLPAAPTRPPRWCGQASRTARILHHLEPIPDPPRPSLTANRLFVLDRQFVQTPQWYRPKARRRARTSLDQLGRTRLSLRKRAPNPAHSKPPRHESRGAIPPRCMPTPLESAVSSRTTLICTIPQFPERCGFASFASMKTFLVSRPWR